MITGHHMDVPAVALNQTGIIGGQRTLDVGVSQLQHSTKEPLRGLNAAQRTAIQGVQHAVLVVDHLHRVGDRDSGNDGRMAISYGVDHPGEQVRGRQGPGNIMDQHDAVPWAQRAQTCFDRRRPILPASHNIHPAVLAEKVGGGPASPDMGRRRHDDDVLHLRATKNSPKCVSQ